MRYRTVIELVCEAADKEDAYTTAGDFLKGDVDFGVDMKCNTEPLVAHKMYKYGATCLITFLVFSALLVKVLPLGSGAGIKGAVKPSFNNSYTIQPELKTTNKAEFKKDWDRKQDEVMLEFLKK